MIDLVRQEIVTAAHTIVVKIGSNVLTDDTGRLDVAQLQQLTENLAAVRHQGKRLVVVSSGAVAAGVGRLRLSQRPTDLRHLQAAAATGQCHLMRCWDEAFASHDIPTAQILLTAGDFENRTRYLNARNTILTLFEWGVVPIINENDTVSVDEIRFGDNDMLAAQVTNLLQAPLLILLSVVDGLYDTDPTCNPAAKRFSTVEKIDAAVMALAGDRASTMGTGGMLSKLRAAAVATSAGESVILAGGRTANCLQRIISGEKIGTLFLPQRDSMPAWKRWLGFSARSRGTVIVDAGARKAVELRGRSLLPIGVRQISGRFEKGDPVTLCDEEGNVFGRGLVNYGCEDAARIAGLRSDQIAAVLGGIPYEEMIHRDNLVIYHK